MSIADELNHYAGGLEDAYDAVNDMNGVIPANRNMDNLDTAIRTIPQPTVNDGTLTIQKNGTSVATFTANQASNATANITVPTNTSDLNNDSGFITSSSLPGDMTGATSGTAGAHGLVPAPAAGDEGKFLSGAGTWATASSGGSYSAGNGISIDANNEISIDTSVVAEVSDIPTNTSDLVNDGADGTSTYVEADELATVATSGSYADLLNTPIIPAAQVNSDWNANSGVTEILNKPSLAAVATSGAYSDLTGTPTIPTVNNATLIVTQNGTSAGTFTANASSDVTIALTDTTYSTMTGATSGAAGTSGLVPAPAAGDNAKALYGDGTWKLPGMTILKYGTSTYAEALAAYQANNIIYARASSNTSNPGTGDQLRMAFLAYVNNETTPTEFEFQYYRSVAAHSDSTQGDEVFIYKLKQATGWEFTKRNAYSKIAAGTNMSSSYSSGTLTLSATDTTYSAFTGAASGTAGTSGLVPAPAAGDEAKVLAGDGTWVAQPTVNDATLTIQQNGTTVDTFTANSSTSKTVNIVTADDTYSTTEIDTGKKWFDNKTIYRKVYTGTWSASGVQSVTVVTDSSVADIIATGGWFDDGYAKIPFGQAHWTNAKSGTIATNGASYALITSSGLNIRLLSVDTMSNKPYEIWVEYTKAVV